MVYIVPQYIIFSLTKTTTLLIAVLITEKENLRYILIFKIHEQTQVIKT